MRRLAAVLALVLLATCSDRTTGPVDPSAPGLAPQPGLDPGLPATPQPSGAVTTSSPDVAIFDGAHNGGNPHFFFRPAKNPGDLISIRIGYLGADIDLHSSFRCQTSNTAFRFYESMFINSGVEFMLKHQISFSKT